MGMTHMKTTRCTQPESDTMKLLVILVVFILIVVLFHLVLAILENIQLRPYS